MALPAERSLPLMQFPEKVRRFVGPETPPQLQQMAARGMVPVPPAIQVRMLYQVYLHGDEGVRTAASETLKGMPEAVLEGIVGQELPAVVLDWFAHQFGDRPTILERMLRNRFIDDDTTQYLASHASEDVAETIAQNERRLLRAPGIIEALYFNEHTRMSTADRIIELAARNGLRLTKIPMFDEVVAALEADRRSEVTTTGLEESLDGSMFAEPVPPSAPSPATQAPAQRITTLDDTNVELEKQLGDNAAARIRQLNVAQKVRLAMTGNKTERGLLIKDSNKVVARAVIRSPRITEPEVLEFAGNRGLDREVIAIIAGTRDWTKNYNVRVNLVQNPKTPMGNSMTFLKTLRTKDLRDVARSKNVPAVIARTARQLVQARS